MKKTVLFLLLITIMSLSNLIAQTKDVAIITDIKRPANTPELIVQDSTTNLAIQKTESVALISNPIEDTVFNDIVDAILAFFNMVNWLFVVVFIIVAWLTNETAEATNNWTGFLSFWNKIPKAIRTLIMGVLIMGAFIFLFDYRTKPEITEMLFGILVSMVIYKIGLNKFLRWFSTKLGFKFE